MFKVEVTAHLFLAYLQDCKIINDVKKAKWKEQSKKSVLILINVDGEFAKAVLGEAAEELEIVLVDMSDGKKVMISLCNDVAPIKQGILHYDADLKLQTEVTEDHDGMRDMYDVNTWNVFQGKFKLSAVSCSTTDVAKGEDQGPEVETLRRQLKLAKDKGIPIARAKAPDDMPGFEDEYEIQGERHVPPVYDPDLFPSREHTRPGTYGDRDLYPTGEKYPDILDPSPSAGPKGGMVFDPKHSGSLPLPYGGKFDPDDPDDPRKPSGFLPGARWNSPFGSSRGFPGFGSPGSGKPGFL
ncbi:Fub1p Ecym_2508 [Eremothecium cymbalariae DBVPG|uniref:PI31 proteasome regulator C-terminal domain-containing protein n=1 Tax=Eremothecium cymbalariae (strain CBS 270.75 / DBVPG 7215 / KCTC 17166 / NRRL Y-17582) TaxID=931890 RepID=G8JPX1_ERECY|nr:Hypothetical protein Ecym_2508 [Eremothecium cymbalariae DBVPG\